METLLTRAVEPYHTQPVLVNPPDRLDEFAFAIEQFAPGFVEQIPVQGAGASDWIDAISKTATALVMTNAQRELLAVQIERARNGQPPLDSSEYGLGATVGVSPEPIERAGLVGGGLIVLWALLARGRR